MTYHLDIHPPDVSNDVPPDESSDSCEHSEIICAACEEEDARAREAEKETN